MKKGWMGLVACGTLGLAAQAQARTCAYMFQDVNFGGEVLEVQEGALVPDMGSHWNDRVSSVKVVAAEECLLNVYENVNFEGEYNVLGADVPDVGEWKNRISSYYCHCYERPPGR